MVYLQQAFHEEDKLEESEAKSEGDNQNTLKLKERI